MATKSYKGVIKKKGGWTGYKAKKTTKPKARVISRKSLRGPKMDPDEKKYRPSTAKGAKPAYGKRGGKG